MLQVRTFLNLLPSSEADNEKFTADQPLEVVPINPIITSIRLNIHYYSTL
jgi:hypothetical protein